MINVAVAVAVRGDYCRNEVRAEGGGYEYASNDQAARQAKKKYTSNQLCYTSHFPIESGEAPESASEGAVGRSVPAYQHGASWKPEKVMWNRLC
jgi:hypothetical protein